MQFTKYSKFFALWEHGRTALLDPVRLHGAILLLTAHDMCHFQVKTLRDSVQFPTLPLFICNINQKLWWPEAQNKYTCFRAGLQTIRSRHAAGASNKPSLLWATAILEWLFTAAKVSWRMIFYFFPACAWFSLIIGHFKASKNIVNL